MKTLALILYILCINSIARAEAPAPAVCFSPDGDCEKPLAAFLSTAHQSLDVAIYDINEPSIVAAIEAVAARGIHVRVACDKKQAAGPHSAIHMLVAAGITVRYGHQKGIMHNKFSVVDGLVLETGSYNYTTHATAANQENQYYSHDPAVVAAYQERFEKIWAGGVPVGK